MDHAIYTQYRIDARRRFNDLSGENSTPADRHREDIDFSITSKGTGGIIQLYCRHFRHNLIGCFDMKNRHDLSLWHCLALTTWMYIAADLAADPLQWIAIAKKGNAFIQQPSGKVYVPWGFNYDHDENGRLIEDYWEAEWPKVEQDFREMKALGANVVRVHFQLGKFMKSAIDANPKALERLSQLLQLAEREALYLDITGLGCYHKKDVPEWYDRLAENERWDAQARFWEAIAERGSASPAVFCYDLMNEPVVPGGSRKPKEWLGPAFAGKHFVQFITLEQKGRPRPEIAALWIKRLTSAIRKHDRRHLVTVGLVDWSLDRPGLTSGFVPKSACADLDFLCVHIYPERNGVAKALETLAGFSIGKPVVIEETFPLKCSMSEFDQFIEGTEKSASGWIGFYWGKTKEECRRANTIGDAIMVNWLEYFEGKARARRP